MDKASGTHSSKDDDDEKNEGDKTEGGDETGGDVTKPEPDNTPKADRLDVVLDKSGNASNVSGCGLTVVKFGTTSVTYYNHQYQRYIADF